ncbi:MAG: peptidoglycan-binding protein, partial [Hydrogenophaga sp.]|nr:peptidoglycan-binding protein [Hydrogenophaga sp.]
MVATLLATLLLVSGCSTPMDARKDASFQSYAHASDRPTTRPVRSLSSFSDSLMCMDRLFRDAQIPTTLITSKQIPDFSGRVPVATKDMIITAISQMSRLSNAFRYVDFEVDIARQDTVQNLTTILLNNNQIRLQRPALYVSGAVAFVDQNVINNRFDVGTSASRLETGYSRDKSATIIGMELHLGDFRSR